MKNHASAHFGFLASFGLSTALLFACGTASGAEQISGNAKVIRANTGGTKTSAIPNAVPLGLTMLEVMRATVQPVGDGIWAVQYAEKITDQEWQLVEQDSISLAAAATLISLPGIGKPDRSWVANADWQAWAVDVQKTALTIKAAAKTKDQTAMSNAAGHLAEICQRCHDKYQPASPTDSVTRYPYYPKRVIQK